MEEREIVVAALGRLSRRLHLNRGLADVASATSLLLLLLVGLEILPLLVSFPSSAKSVSVPLFLAGWAGWLTWKLTRRESLGRAAGLADRRAHLKDELKTAFHFISRGETSPWVETQIHRAAARARALDAKALVPITVPRTAPLALGLAGALGLFLWLAPEPHARGFASEKPLSAEESAQIEDIRNLIRDSAPLGEEGSPDAEALQNLEKAFRLWERGDISREEALAELRQARDALAQRELDSASLREGLGKAGDSLKGAEELAALAEALKKAELAEVAELLRALSEKLSEREGSAKLQDLLDRLARSLSTGNADLDELLAKLKEATENRGDGPERAEQSLEAAAASLEALARRMAGDGRLSEAGRKLQVLTGMMQARDAAEGGERVSAPGEQGGSSPGPPGGSGEAGSDPGDATRLAVQLEIEKLASQRRPAEPEPEEITHEATREEPSKLPYREVGRGASYAKAEAMRAERIPWRHRQLVKDYFLALRPSAEK